MSSDKFYSLNKLTVGNGRFIVGKQIGKGSFGEIRLGYMAASNEKVAIKMEPTNLKTKQLPFEYSIYKDKLDSVVTKPNRPIGIPALFYYGPCAGYDALVIELLGPDLDNLFEKNQNKFSIKTICQIGIQLMNRFEYIHSRGIIYRDVKPENFLLGNQEKPEKKNIIYVIDFGLSKEYIENGRHIEFQRNKPLTGTARYMSINTHDRLEQSRRDDLKAIGYVLFYFLRGRLPWQGLQAANAFQRYQKINIIKKNTRIEDLMHGHSGPVPRQFGEYLKLVRALNFEEKPDYNRYRNLFKQVLVERGIKEDHVYDWNR